MGGSRGRGRLARGWADIARHPLWSAVAAGLIVTALLFLVSVLAGAFDGDSSEEQLGGWFPQRVAYRCSGPHNCLGADHVVFNSMINTSSYGDERAFFDARLARDEKSPRSHNVLDVEVGQAVILRGYVDNNANGELATGGSDTAVGTRFRVSLPDRAAAQQVITAFISADNAHPPVVGDTVILRASEPVNINYIEGSAKLVNDKLPDGLPLSDTIISDGALVGCRAADGVFLGGTTFCDALVELRVRVGPESAPLD